MARARMSAPPPGAAGTMMRTSPVGKVCARSGQAATESPPAKVAQNARREITCFSFPFASRAAHGLRVIGLRVVAPRLGRADLDRPAVYSAATAATEYF